MKTQYNEVISGIKRNQDRLKEGKFNCIPFPLKKLNKHLHGIIKGTPYIVTANSGVGKTILSKFLFLFSVVKFLKENPDSGITVEIHYFPLEESQEEFILSLVSRYMYEVHNKDIDINQLRGYDRDHTLTEEDIQLIEESTRYFQELFEYATIVDDISNPTGIYKYLRRRAVENGKFFYKGKEVTPPKDNDWSDFHYDNYVENNPDHYIISIVDHISLLKEESGKTKHEIMTTWSADYARTSLTKKFKQIVVHIQQQSADSEKQQYNNRGEPIPQKVEPSLDGLGDNRLTQRDALVVISFFAPHRYGFEEWGGYDITRLKDNFRVIKILKNRYGTPNLVDYVFFNGAVNEIKELPEANSSLMVKVYKKAKEIQNRLK